MGDVTLAARVLLACVFAVAAIAKLLSQATSPVASRDFGVPDRVARLAEPLLPPVELAVAITLLLQPTARLGAAGATLLLVIFSAGVANALRHGRRPQCGCFGGLSADPISGSTLARNGLLAALAGFAAGTAPGTSLQRWLSTGGHILITLGLAVTALSVLAASRRSRHAGTAPGAGGVTPPALASRLLGQQAPAFALDGASGPRLTLDSLCADGRPLVLVFGDPGCGPCASLFGQLGTWQATITERVRIAVVAFGDRERTRAICTEHNLSNVLYDPDGSTWRAYGVAGGPVGFAVSPDQTVISGPAIGADLIEDLIRLTLQRARPAHRPAERYGVGDRPNDPARVSPAPIDWRVATDRGPVS
jgi:hypothetical protein